MATVHGTLDQPIDEATASIRRVASEHGYAIAEGLGPPSVLVFKKGASLWSWGSQVSFELAPASPSSTRLTVTTGETFAITDWGRGKRAAQKLLGALGVVP